MGGRSKEGDTPYGLSIEDTGLCIYEEGRNGGGKVGVTACGLSIKDTYSCVYVCPEFLIHPWPFTFLWRGGEHFVSEFSESPFVL